MSNGKDVNLNELEVDALEEVIRFRINHLCTVDDMSEVIDQRIQMWNGILIKLDKEPKCC